MPSDDPTKPPLTRTRKLSPEELAQLQRHVKQRSPNPQSERPKPGKK